MGMQGSAIPEAFGGVEADYLTLCVVAREVGSALAPIPFSSYIYQAAKAIVR